MKKNKGFTLIELLAVIVILGIMLAISVVAVNKIRKNQEVENKRNVISSILTGAKRYFADEPSKSEVRVKYLVEKDYADFDISEYDEFDNDSIKVFYNNECPNDSNKLKRAFYVSVNGKTYNDCGCAIQTGGVTGKKLCSGQNGTDEANIN